MGAGKTSVGRELAVLLDWGFSDLDELIETRAGAPVARLFARHGEEWFREQERLVAEGLTSSTRLVIAAGGGAWVQPQTRALLAHDAVSVWLRCPLEVMMRRIGSGGTRPLATNRAKMAVLLQSREPAYRLADLSVEASQVGPGAVARTVIRAVFGLQAHP